MSSREFWKSYTSARIGIGRSGGSIPTSELLKFRLDHARARDAVLVEPDFGALYNESEKIFRPLGIETISVESLAKSREEYLLRPDLGRRISEPSRARLEPKKGDYDLALLGIDGLSAKALDSNLIPFLQVLVPILSDKKYSLAPFILGKLGRVAIGDEIGEILGAKAVILLIGERPGLTSADSIGMYLTFSPKLGKTDESRNCISNIRPDGLDFRKASLKTAYLLAESLKRGISGVDLKDEMPPDFLESSPSGRISNGS
ncbi:ethanolamine ammonia-lyase subunit EutC [Leptospira sarikeiensis]|uniref:Ethanolamine ammonia-lyase small subunit n=1 Tax=Leptospira sarikeiensis TaxID=2484943 RepID=A0A4R9K3P9_9LEPT|nr:ethanolamine ammonia-lyase subunit EutC [Leptospira sarikeiensis]TGL60700.1 ethanolamine ammonia-lyase subunit EutC [Leptospira sarikeiensis]